MNLPTERHPEVVADRGRRPHVPSSKPTMSKSRRVSLPVFIRDTGMRLRETRAGLGRCPAPSVKGHIWRTIPTVNTLFFGKCVTLLRPSSHTETMCPCDGRIIQRPNERAEALPIGLSDLIFKENSDLPCGPSLRRWPYGGPAPIRQASSPEKPQWPLNPFALCAFSDARIAHRKRKASGFTWRTAKRIGKAGSPSR